MERAARTAFLSGTKNPIRAMIGTISHPIMTIRHGGGRAAIEALYCVGARAGAGRGTDRQRAGRPSDAVPNPDKATLANGDINKVPRVPDGDLGLKSRLG